MGANTRPNVEPDWATAANFANPPIAGQPNKAAPGGGMVSEGFDPEDYFRVEHMNFMLNNHGQFLKYLDNAIAGAGMIDADEFLDGLTGRWDTLGTTAPFLQDDSAAGAFGCLKFNPGAAQTTILRKHVAYGLSAQDWSLSVRVRLPNAIAAGQTIFMGVIDGGGHEVSWNMMQGVRPNNNWFVFNDVGGGGGTYHDTGVLPANTYQHLRLLSLGGTLTAWINGTPVYTTAYVNAFSGSFVSCPELSVFAGGGAAFDVRFDSCKLWVDR